MTSSEITYFEVSRRLDRWRRLGFARITLIMLPAARKRLGVCCSPRLQRRAAGCGTAGRRRRIAGANLIADRDPNGVWCRESDATQGWRMRRVQAAIIAIISDWKVAVLCNGFVRRACLPTELHRATIARRSRHTTCKCSHSCITGFSRFCGFHGKPFMLSRWETFTGP